MSATRRRPKSSVVAAFDVTAVRRPQWFSLNVEVLILWLLFIATHVLYGWVSSWHGSRPMNDVTSVYRGWLDGAAVTGSIPGIHEAFVYPVAALAPMWLADFIGGHDRYGVAWILIVLMLNLVALWWLTLRNRFAVGAGLRRVAAWFWLAFLLAIGPIGIGRIDAITVPIVVIALFALRERATLGGTALTIGAWIKVWPAAPFAAAFVVFRRRWRIVLGGVLGSALVLVPVMVFADDWGIEHLFSFVTEQTGRGLQVESFAASVFLVASALGVPGYEVAFDTQILTTQITGPGTEAVGRLLTPLMFVVMFALLVYAWWAQRRGVRIARLFPSLTLALVVTFMIVNKVGSPQFFTWLAPAIVLGLVWDARWFRGVALIAIAVAGLTQIIYPWYYGHVTAAIPWAAVTLLARNLLALALLVFSVVRMTPRVRRSGSVTPPVVSPE